MFKPLLRFAAILAATAFLTSCGGLKTKDVVLDETIKIMKQDLSVEVYEEQDEDELYLDLIAPVKIEFLKDFDSSNISMYLFDKDEVKLIELISGTMYDKKSGDKEVVEFSMRWSEEKTKSQLQDIVKRTVTAKFDID